MADAATLEATAKILLKRADDLYYVGQQLVQRGNDATWQCAKGDRFRQAMQARRTECTRLAIQLRDLGRVLRAEAAVAAAAPASMPVPPGT